jgi:hypothetical protein
MPLQFPLITPGNVRIDAIVQALSRFSGILVEFTGNLETIRLGLGSRIVDVNGGLVSCGPALDEPSRSGSADRTGVRADDRESGSVSVWQADCACDHTSGVILRSSVAAVLR